MSEINYNYNNMTPFKWFILENFPFLEDGIDALTNYQLFCKLGEEINKNRDAINEIGENEEDVVNGFNQLYNWFNTLDVQEEINNKLDEMADTGELTTLIGAYVQPRIDAQNEEIQTFKTQTNTNISTQQQSITNMQNTLTNTLDEFQSQINGLSTGSPLVASSTSGMTNTSRIYVNTTDGKWYYYDGDSWEIGGTYQTTGIADGSISYVKLSNDLQYNLNSRINDKDFYVFEKGKNIVLSENLVRKNVNHYAEIGEDSTTVVTTLNKIYIPHDADIEVVTNTNNLQIEVFFYDKDGTVLDDSILKKRRIDNTKYIFNTFTSNYIRIRFTSSTTLTVANVTDSVVIKFVPNILLQKPEYTQGTNLLNSAKTKTGYLNNSTSPYTMLTSGSYHTALIPITNGTTYYVSQFRKKALYDSDLLYVANSFVDSSTSGHSFTASFDGYLAISYNTTNVFVCTGSSGSYTPYVETLPDYVQLSNTSNLSSIVEATNILVGKKYVALGDSFTHGDFTNSPTDDYTFDSGTYSGEYKVYPFIIGDRNNMTVVNLAVNGMTLTNINSTSNNYLSDSVLANIPEDTDYITIKIGINDNPGHQNAPLGTIDDNVSSTFYGSWNRVMNYLITNYPNAKIGIIVSNGQVSENFVNATINIAKKYGVSYINESTDDRVPLLIRTLRSDVADSIKSARDTAWEVYPPSNMHPNVKCHEYESTIIENFLKSL